MKKLLIFCIVILVFGVTSAMASNYVQLGEKESAEFLAEKGVIKSVKNFRIADFVSRGEILKVTAKLSNDTVVDKCEGKFKDVSKASWQCKYVEWALRKGYIAQNNSFRPNDQITKTEAVKLLLKVKGIEKTQKTSSWQNDYMETAYAYGLISSKYMDYNASATRGWIFQIATATIKKEQEIQKKQEEKLMSDEA